MTPEEKARVKIDQMFEDAGWQVVEYVASNGAVSVSDIRNDDKTRAAQFIRTFGSKEAAADALLSLYKFVVRRKTA